MSDLKFGVPEPEPAAAPTFLPPPEPTAEEAVERFKARVNKKGNRSWKSGSKLALTDTATEQIDKNGLHFRWVERTDSEIGRRIDQGFAFANRVNGAPVEGSAENPAVPGSTPTRHDLVGMVTTKENAAAYHEDNHRRIDERQRTITERAKVAQREQFGVDNVYGRTTVTRQRLEID